jgi:hypothetical protein
MGTLAMTTASSALPRPTLEILSIEQIRTMLAESKPIVFSDPVLARMDLPIRLTFYPLGFPLEISTNCEEIIDRAADIWGKSSKLFDTPTLQMEVAVTEGASGECPPAPICRMRQHLCSNIANGENFAISDLSRGFSSISITRDVLDHPGYLRNFFLEATGLCQIATRFTTPVHAACIALDGCGILLCGDSGAGKSTLSYACARAGWTYITDDGSYLINGREDGLAVGNCRIFRFRPSAGDIFPELHGRPIMQRAQTGKPSIELPATPSRRFTTRNTTVVRHVVFLNRHAGSPQELAAFPTDIARNFILQRLCHIPELQEVQMRTVERLLANGAFELRYTDLDWAIQRLGQLAREGR